MNNMLTNNEYTYYCPVDVFHFPGMTYQDFSNLDDAYEDWFMQEHKIQDFVFLKEDAAAYFDRQPDLQELAYLEDDFPEIFSHVAAVHADFADRGGRLWFNMAFALTEDTDSDRMREFAARCICDYAMQTGSFQKDEGLYLMSIEPHEIYNQTHCAAPVYQENALLTEEELQALISEEETEDDGESDDYYEDDDVEPEDYGGWGDIDGGMTMQ